MRTMIDILFMTLQINFVLKKGVIRETLEFF